MKDQHDLNNNRNLIKLPTLATVLDRYKVTDRIGAAIASATLQDIGLVNETNKRMIIDPSKVGRARHQQRSCLQNKINFNAIKGLYFDGRKDKSLALKENFCCRGAYCAN